MKNVMRPEEKIFLVLTYLKDQILIKSASDMMLDISTYDFLNEYFAPLINMKDLEGILNKLSEDFNLIGISKKASYTGSIVNGKWQSIELPTKICLSDKDGIIKKHIEYANLVGAPIEPSAIGKSNILELSLSSQNEVILNDYFKLKKLQSEKENALVLGYLIKNPNKTVAIEDILKLTGLPKFTKDFYDILRGLGLNKQMRELFFDYSKDKVQFNNPITKEKIDQYLSENRAKYINLDTETDFPKKKSEELLEHTA